MKTSGRIMFKNTTMLLIMSLLWLIPLRVIAANLDVCPSGCNYTSIQEAINSSLPGDVIRVAEGTYREPISIVGKSNLTIKGSYAGNLFAVQDYSMKPAIIDSQGIANTIFVSNSIGIVIDGFVIKNGQAVDGAGVKIVSDGANINTTASLSNSVVTENIATYGGGIAIVADNQGSCTFNMNNVEVVGNRANYGAGVAVNAENGGIIGFTSSNNRVCNNEADRYNYSTYGGGLYVRLYGAGANLSMISEKDSYCSNRSGGYGGGMAFVTSDSAVIDLSIDNTSIYDNTSGRAGAGIYLHSHTSESVINLINSDIDKNYSNANGGGGMYLYSNSQMNLSLNGNKVSGNASGNAGGGGLYISNMNNMQLNLTENEIYNNGGVSSGGNIYLDNRSNLLMNFSKNILFKGSIQNNGTGAGLYFSNTGVSAGELSNNLFYENGYSYNLVLQKYDSMETLGNDYNGGAISIINSGEIDLKFINNTITNNFTNSAFYVASSNNKTNLKIYNSILYRNSNKDFYNKDNLASLNISYSNIGEPFGLYNNMGGNINTDPLFLNKEENDYRLSVYSPCINAGIVLGDTPGYDIDGNLRPLGGGIDMGAFEMDIYPPQIISFRMPTATLDLTVPLHLEVYDEILVVGYIVKENNITPNADDPDWVTTAPVNFTFKTYGEKLLYAFARDAAGNISTVATASTVILASYYDDTDGDGFSDGEEIDCGSNPLDADSICSRGMPWLMLLLDD